MSQGTHALRRDGLAVLVQDDHDVEVARRLAPLLANEQVTPHTHELMIATEVRNHLAEHGERPGGRDWQAFIDRQGDRDRKAVAKKLGQLKQRDLNGATPERVVADVEETARRQLARHWALQLVEELDSEAYNQDEAFELADDLRDALRNGLAWPDPIPLGLEDYPKELPVDGLPTWFRDHMESVADSTQAARDMALLMGLATLSTALAKKGEVRVKAGRTEPLLLWTCTVLESGERKSAVVPKMIRPVERYEQQERRRILDERKPKENRRAVYEKVLKQTIKDASEDTDKLHQVDDVQDQLDALEVPEPPDLLASDVTEERLTMLMAANNGRISVLDAEGDLFALMAGRYTDAAHFASFKKAWSGDTIHVHRVSRDDLHVANPALTLGITTQPVVLEKLAARERFEREGMLARFLWGRPQPMAGRRATGADEPKLDLEARDRYQTAVTALLRAEDREEDEAGEWVPHHLELTEEAREVLHTFESWVEDKLGEGHPLQEIAEWANKLAGQVVRLAGLIHVAHHAPERVAAAWSTPISGEVMKTAARLGRGDIAHARRVLEGHVEESSEVQLAKYVLRKILDDPEDLTERDVWVRCKGKGEIDRMDDLRAVLGRLEEHNMVRVARRPSTGGRPPSPWVRVNPKLLE